MPTSTESPGWIPADWPAGNWIRAGTTIRTGGISRGAYASMNLAGHVGDDPQAIRENRRRLTTYMTLPAEPVWLEQVHGSRVIAAHKYDSRRADAAWTDQPGIVCVVLTADCLPLLLCNRDGTRVAAVHVGWRGLAAGVVQEAITTLAPAGNLLAWLGPCIGPGAFEVGNDVYQACCSVVPGAEDAFVPVRHNHWLADLPQLVRQVLISLGVSECHGDGSCTYSDDQRFYSYRRDGTTGRMASLIWIDANRL